MPNVNTPLALPSHIEDLLSTRESHVEAIGVIDDTLARVSNALGVSPTPLDAPPPVAAGAGSKASATKAAPKASTSKPASAKAPAAPRKRGAVSKFGMSANDFVMEFVRSSKGGATTQEVNKHWIASGRPRNADNSLSILTKAKRLKRVKMPKVPGQPGGSRFTVI